MNAEFIEKRVQQILQDQIIQKFKSELNHKTSCDFYVSIKNDFSFEKYLMCNSLNDKTRQVLIKFRCSNIRIPKVMGGYQNIARNLRICNECHIILECTNQAKTEIYSC